VLILVLIGLVAVSAYSLRQYARLRETRRLQEQQLIEEIGNIVENCRDQIQRHPDYDLSAERAFLDSFSERSPEEQLEDLGVLKEYSRELTESLLFTAAGIRPGEAGWEEAVRYKTYSPGGFRNLYEDLEYPGAQPIVEAPRITGDPEADRRIVDLAVARGYRLRWQADEGALVSRDRHSLQGPVMDAWLELQAAALTDGVDLQLVSAYRSVDRQRQIFLRELRREILQDGDGETGMQAIAAGDANHLVQEVLRYSAIPGFSKHHSGYTIDITDPSGGHAFTDFHNTRGFQWISAHNYLNAKRFGFIPSYPAGAVRQGPDPEPWEYVWIGREPMLTRPSNGQ
jgi:hypothetical protein